MKKTGADPAPRVLVVDDEPDLRNLYELSLVREGYQILSAGSVAEARALMAEQPLRRDAMHKRGSTA